MVKRKRRPINRLIDYLKTLNGKLTSDKYLMLVRKLQNLLRRY